MALTQTRVAQLEQLTDALASGGTLDGTKMHLYDVAIAWNADVTLADLHQASFTGYAASGLIVWGSDFLNGSGMPEVVGDVKTFACTGIASTGIVYGYYLTSTACALIGGEALASPVSMTATGVTIPMVPRFPQSSVQV